MKARTKLRFVRWSWRLATVLILVADVAVIVPVTQVVALRAINPPFTITQLDRAWQIGAWPQRHWRPLPELGHVPDAMVASEDQRFWVNDGFDWDAIGKAMDHNRRNPGQTRGASTITQQVARNVFLWQERTWVRKGLETYYTVLLDIFVPKARILEVYANVAETGPDCFGAEAGAERWFQKSAAALSHHEAAVIAAMLPAPRRWTPRDERVKRRARWIVQNPVRRPGG